MTGGFYTEGNRRRVFFVALTSAEAAPVKKCGPIDAKCVNNNFQQLQTEIDATLFHSDDAKEGFSAFTGRRKPNLSGR